MGEYFAETVIRLEIAGRSKDEAVLVLRMRPLKVKEIPLLLRLAGASRATAGDLAGFVEFIDLLAGTVDGEIKGLHRDALDGLIGAFEKLNFPKGVEKPSAPDKPPKPFDEKEFARQIEFLIHQGHSFSEIEDYTLPRLRLFVELATERLTGKIKKKVNPLDALRGLGIPVRG